MVTPTPFEALSTLVDVAGSQTALAKTLGVSQAAVWKWLQSSKRLPAEHVLKAERLFRVSRHELRPDLYPRGLQDNRPFLLPLDNGIAADADDADCDQISFLQDDQEAA